MDDLTLMRELFINRNDCYPKQKDGVNEYFVIKYPISENLIRKHLDGEVTIGSFQIDNQTNKVKWICFDFDGDLNIEFEKSKKLFKRLKEKGKSPLLEFSGRRGYHIWIFVEPTNTKDAKRFAEEISKGIEVSDIYPKQEKIEITGFGGQVKLPLGIHRASNKRSYLFDEEFNELDKEGSFKILQKIFDKPRDKVSFMTLSDFMK